MKLRNLFLCSLAAVAVLAGCNKEEDGGDSLDIVLSTDTLDFPAEKTTLSVDVTAGREWKVEYSFPDGEEAWVIIDPETAKGNQTVNITCQANAGNDRSVQIKFSNGLKNKTLTITQKGEKGPQGANIVYHNDFDKTKAEKVNNSWQNLDQTEIWKNETGTGLSTIAYASSGVSVRSGSGYADSSSEELSLYKGSGMNNIFFGTTDGYFKVEKISLPQGQRNYTLSFGAIRGVYNAEAGGSIFDEKQFSAYISNDGKKWVKLALTYAAGSAPDGKWDKISSTVTLPANTAELYLYFTTTEKSTYRLDDVDLSLSETSGTAVDFTTGIEFEEEEEEEAPSGTPSGEGTEASPYNVAKAYQVASALEDGKTTAEVYVSGVVSKVDEYFDKYKSVTYYISDEGQKGSFMVYSGKFVGGADFTSMDQIAVGDKVLIRGKLKNYKGTFEFDKNNIIVTLNGKGAEDVKSFGVSRTAISVLASETSATFNVTGNVDWTVTSDNAKFTVSPASGTGEGTVTVSFPANADTENAVTANITVSTTSDEVSTKYYIVVITQAKANAGGSETVLYSEDFGEPSGNTDLAKFEGWSSSLILPTSDKWKVGTTEACALEGSSGKGNAYSGSAATEILFDFADKLAGYKSVKLTFNYKKGSGKGKDNSLECYLSKDGGTNWSDNIIPANTGAGGWYSVSYDVSDEYMADFCIKFANTAGNTNRVDDLKLTGIAK